MKNSKIRIFMATLELAAQQGMGNVSLSKIAEKVGIRKASLYSHFTSKEELICQLHEFLREKTKQENNINTDYGELVKGRTAAEILKGAVENYRKIITSPEMKSFYKFIISERGIHPETAKIMVIETEKMILTTKQLFYAMQIHNVISFKNIDTAAITFAFTVQGILNYQEDKMFAEEKEIGNMLDEFITNFCEAHGNFKEDL